MRKHWRSFVADSNRCCSEVSIVEFFKTNNEEDAVNLPLLEKIKIIDTLDIDEKDALLKLIDMAVSKKKLKDNLTNLIAS